jgi:hypothetical protein
MFWKILIIIGLIAALAGAWLGWTNRQSGIALTAWAREPLMLWVNHTQECHSPGPPAHPAPPATCTPPVSHIDPPPDPPDWK